MSDSQSTLQLAIQTESLKLKETYMWLEKAMPPQFFEETNRDDLMLIAHNLMGFQLQEYFSTIHLKNAAIVLCLDSADADLRILKNYALYGIKYYKTFVSNVPPPGLEKNLRVALIYFTEAVETNEDPLPKESLDELRALAKKQNPDLIDQEFDSLLSNMNARFLRSMSLERLALILDMFFRAKTRDNCQYEVRYNEDWKDTSAPSMQIMLAWRNTPKHNFLYRLARVIHRHGLVMKRVNAAYIDPYSKGSILVMSLGLHGIKGEAAWDAANIPDFLRELVTVKYFASFDLMDESLVSKGVISGNMANLLRAMVNLIHQNLVHIDANLYTILNIEEDLCRHPELTVQICEAFAAKFEPGMHDHSRYERLRKQLMASIKRLDTGNEEMDQRRKNVLLQAMNVIENTLKTNFYRTNYTAISFRLDPKYLDEIPFDRTRKFPELPYAIFYMKGMHFFGFHIRFKDLARGGLRTIYPQQPEQIEHERNSVFTECYNLAYTQHKKNKDIPEGGAKGIIFLRPYERLESEALILAKELGTSVGEKEIEQKVSTFREEQTVEYLYQSQRSYIESMITIVNCEPDGTLRAKHIVDYWKKPEYIYLGPDENMHDPMIQWIADFSKKYDYKPGGAFITSKPHAGINHKHYGVTSLGVNVYMDALLRYMGIDPTKERFTIKMTGGPDGDVAGNQIVNLYKHYPDTAKLIALTDGSGTIKDREGLDLGTLNTLFHAGKSIAHYPPEMLHEGGFLLNKLIKRTPKPLVQQTLFVRKENGKLIEEWLSGNEMNNLYRHNVHETKSDIFIPAGGRPRTLNHSNFKEFLDETGKPTARGIVEGANLYLTQDARRGLEEAGVLIIKDSSANKTGVICSSFEVLCGLTLGDELFIENKEILVSEILERLKECAANEANLLLSTHKETGGYLTEISEHLSLRINQFTYQLLDYLEGTKIPTNAEDPLLQTFLTYCLPTLRNRYQSNLLSEIPDNHKKAIIASQISAHLVYKRGLAWYPSVVDIFPILLRQKN